MPKKPSLTYREIRILHSLAKGHGYAKTCQALGMAQANLHTTCALIRKKTGIAQTRDAQECRRYLSKLNPQTVADALNYAPTKHDIKPPTSAQLEALRLLAMGRTPAQIATFFGTNVQSVHNLASRGCKRAGITHNGWDRTRFIREWLEARDEAYADAPEHRDPMNDPAF